MAGEPNVRVEGLRELHRALRRTQPEVDKGLRKELRDMGEKVASDASARAPRRTGEYARSIRSYVTVKGVSVGSRLPQAGVLHWGGTIRPRGTPIHFQARPVITEAVDRRTGELVDDVGDAIDRAARRAGWL